MKYRIIQENNLFKVEEKFLFSWKTVRFFDANIGPRATWFKTFEQAKKFVDDITKPKDIKVVWEQK